jgi:hypothetical protein
LLCMISHPHHNPFPRDIGSTSFESGTAGLRRRGPHQIPADDTSEKTQDQFTSRSPSPNVPRTLPFHPPLTAVYQMFSSDPLVMWDCPTTFAGFRLFIYLPSFRLSHHLLKGGANALSASINGCSFASKFPRIKNIPGSFLRYRMTARMHRARNPYNPDWDKRILVKKRKHKHAPFCLSAPAGFAGGSGFGGWEFPNVLDSALSGGCARHKSKRFAFQLVNRCRSLPYFCWRPVWSRSNASRIPR